MKQDQDWHFPINTDTACTSKWSWSTIWLNAGTTSSCHRCDAFTIPKDDFGSFHNVPGKIKNRQDMLEGKWPGDGCEYCRDIEAAGGFSDRMHNNDIAGYAPMELKDNPTEVYVTPTILEIFAENTCNFRCVYCSVALSSRIEQEVLKYEPENHYLKRQTGPNRRLNMPKQQIYNEFFDWLEENVHKLVRLHLLGGETFIQHSLMERTLDLLERKPSEGLQLCIFSNFNPPDKYFKHYVERIKYLWQQGNIGRFDLTASIDCWGPQAEYVRNGLDCEKFEENFAFAAEQPEEFLYLNVNQTVSSFTMKTMPELIRMFNKYNEHRHIGHYAMLVSGNPFMRPEVFGYDTWDSTWQRIYREMRSDTIEHQQAIKIMSGLQGITRTNTEHNTSEIKKLYNYFDENDRRRNSNWRSLWPELVIPEIDNE